MLSNALNNRVRGQIRPFATNAGFRRQFFSSLSLAAVWLVVATAVEAAPSEPEWELTTIDLKPKAFADNNPDLPNIARIVNTGKDTGKNSVSYEFFKKNQTPFTVAFNWTDPLPARVKLNETVTIQMGAPFGSGQRRLWDDR